ncbi:Mfm1p KNAG_0A02080 [Huiozyma naganishii CBS 8797]|uniref:Magnesium transporter n=1 Tax=Huiozyma naganishii (strain ATCC MYA-139 / BCRC 22969 / CBS 8797 / KCTC 17520 / NBRC 10181 / NCYC 3082 / Yp74L-3) TaxID=1071383 RepID=J7RT62_HUIN7|nr:hypothetical protein KNAG_0A02080 [Kazachstania naganishii CBS 8797]CCK67897.1 hypothetical protein KNAG_0A02080 [Kazachstania naganishii CBS 8797]
MLSRIGRPAVTAVGRCYTSISNNATSTLLQKTLIQNNNMLSGYGANTIRCTIFNIGGDMTAPSLEMKRDELVSKHGLLPRDLRKIEKSKHNDLVPSLLVRRNGILLSLLAHKALIKPDMVLIFDSVGSSISLNSTTQQNFITDLQRRLKNCGENAQVPDPLPYEFRVLEAIFTDALSNLTSELKVLLAMSDGILNDLEYNITRDKLRFLLIQNKKLSAFYKKSLLVRDMIDDLLEQDDVMCDMYLTDKANGRTHLDDDHDEVEMLLETYHNYIDEIVQMSENAISNVKTTEEVINIILDSNRNQLMLLGVRFSIGMLSLGGAIFVGSVYGMNLENLIEETNYGFTSAVVVGCISTVWLYVASIRKLHRLQKMTLLNPMDVVRKKK